MPEKYCFGRREDNARPTPSSDSRFRNFFFYCAGCGSKILKLAAQHDEESGETWLVVNCERCRNPERVKL